MPKGPVCGTVYVWYPDDGHIGHAAMYIGNYAVGRKFELSLDADPRNALHVAPSALEASYITQFGGPHYNDNYVSWWPDDGGADLINPNTDAAPMLGLYRDVEAEESEPHVTYTLYGLDVTAMRAQWRKDRDKAGAHYKLYGKNCSSIVARVMRAGGAHKHLGKLASAWFAHNAIWTPHKVARFCNHLRPDHAVKVKAGNCPEKAGKLMSVIGLR